MICSGPSTLCGEQNEVFPSRLIGTNSENKREIKGQMRVVLRLFHWLCSLCGKNLLTGEKRKEVKQNGAQRRQAGPVTNYD